MAKEAKLDAVKFGIAGGVVWGVCVLLTTIAGIFGWFAGYNFVVVSIYGVLGYSLSWSGVILGLIYGFIDGFIGAGVFAWLYNKLL